MTVLRTLGLLTALLASALRAEGQTESAAQDSTARRVKTTTVWAACVPGSGQIMNRQAWKAPVVWGGMGYAGWAAWNNASEMRASLDDLVALTDDDPSTSPVLTDAAGNFYTESQLEDRALFYRRNRDLSVLGFLIAHGLQVLDANTGALLRTLDTSDQLSARLGTTWGVPSVHLAWNLNSPRHEP
jgi:hypothetical protein